AHATRLLQMRVDDLAGRQLYHFEDRFRVAGKVGRRIDVALDLRTDAIDPVGARAILRGDHLLRLGAVARLALGLLTQRVELALRASAQLGLPFLLGLLRLGFLAQPFLLGGFPFPLCLRRGLSFALRLLARLALGLLLRFLCDLRALIRLGRWGWY